MDDGVLGSESRGEDGSYLWVAGRKRLLIDESHVASWR